MKLYSKFDKMQRIRLVHPRTKRVKYEHEYMLMPTRPTEVDDVIAEMLLKQDPHLISVTPFGYVSLSADKQKVVDASPSTGLMAVVEELEAYGVDNLKASAAVVYADRLGIPSGTIYYSIPKKKRAAILITRMDEIKAEAGL